MSQVLANVKCRWASLQEPNTRYDDAYEVECILSPEQAATLRAQGLAVKEDDEKQLFYRFKNKVYGKRKADESLFEKPGAKPRVVDMNKEPFYELIGNGSVINVLYDLREWTGYSGSGVKADLRAVQVVDHVPFSGNEPVNLDEFDSVATTDADEDDSPF